MTTIIKYNGAASAGAQCAAFNLDDLAAKANLYLADVRSQAEAILAEAREEAAQMRRQAAEQGRADALKSAQQQAAAKAQKDVEQRLASLTPALTAAVGEIRSARSAWLSHWEQRAVELAIAIAARVLRREAEQTPAVTLALVREALELAAGAGRITLHLNPRDRETLGDPLNQVVSSAGKSLQVDVVADSNVAPGGCLVTTELGEIDQRLESQLARIQDELTAQP